ncbi:MAG TPA: glycosyltransferase family 1 protein [Deltaproteobacteria bacterium]|nr:glycosyltransferase family 1 protein [Deltaproteobacteria bacterium]
MKILQINNFHYRRGGSEAVYFNTAALLKQKGHKVFFFSKKDDNSLPYEFSAYFPQAINYRKITFLSKLQSVSTFLYNKEAYKNINAYIRRIKPDIAHVHLFMGGLTLSALKALKENNIPVVHSVHDYRLICPAYLFLDGKNNICERCKTGNYLNCIIHRCSENFLTQSAILALDAYARKYLKKPIDYINEFLFVSNFAKQKHIYFDSSFSSKSSVIYNFMPGISEIDCSKKNDGYLLFLGRLSREKGIVTLLESLAGTNHKLKVAGTGPLFDMLKSMATNNIELLGYKSGDELKHIIRQARFIVVPSEWYENNPMSVIEALAYGKPVIGSAIGGIPEIVVDGKTGFLFEPHDKEALKEKIDLAMAMDENKYMAMSENAKAFAHENFSPEAHYKNLIELYDKLVNKTKH